MSDKELQLLAAKAAGIEHPGGEHSVHNDGRLWDCKALRWWNPLHDDGDALRLAVKMRLDFGFPSEDCVWSFGRAGDVCREQPGSAPYAATRRAIVRAAAQLGKAKP